MLRAAQLTGEAVLLDAFNQQIDWLIRKAPRSQEGILFHLTNNHQIWVDSIYMAPPCLAVAGYYGEAISEKIVYP